MSVEKYPAVFLDRDGVLNVDKGYVHKIADFEWMRGAREAIKFANDNRFLVIVVTNQSGIARGYYSEEDVRALHDWINEQLALDGAKIDAFYYCPFHPEGSVPEYSRISDMRKPGPGMILQAFSDWNIDTARSFFIGDSETDIIAADRAGIRGHLIRGESLYQLVVEYIGALSTQAP